MQSRENLGCGQLLALVLGLTVMSTGISAASAAAGMATLNFAGYPGYTEANEAVLSATIGTSLVTGALLTLKITSTLCCASMGIELESNKNGAEPVVGTIASIVAGMLVGHTILKASGAVKELELGPALAASAVGGAEITAGVLLLVCCGCCYCFCAGTNPIDELENTINGDFAAKRSKAFEKGLNSTKCVNQTIEEGRAPKSGSATLPGLTREWGTRNQKSEVVTGTSSNINSNYLCAIIK